MRGNPAVPTTTDRFDYAGNLSRTRSYGSRHSAFWPPTDSYTLHFLDLEPATPPVGAEFLRDLARLKSAIEAEWRARKESGHGAGTSLADPAGIAAALRGVGGHLTSEADRRAVDLRARAVAAGYDDSILEELAGIEDQIAIVGGNVATWYGKQSGGLPTAFGCRRDAARQQAVTQALADLEDVRIYFVRLHADLRLGALPAFVATELFFMAGEGNLHPKHIAYFLPEDEGVKHSPHNKTYYFGNTHGALLESVSAPLAGQFLDIGAELAASDPRFAAIPVLGVLGHEIGHSVRRPSTRFEALHAADRWASAVLQEVAADVFGILVLADVWAERLAIAQDDAIAYYLAECLRYVDRGLGHFPDSDGMYLQLSYLAQLGALWVGPGRCPRLVGKPETVLAALRSLARVLADALLCGAGGPAVALYRAFGPAAPSPVRPLLDPLRRQPPKSVAYVQEHLYEPAGPGS